MKKKSLNRNQRIHFREGEKYSNWCVGIVNDVRQRLFGDYRVNEKSDDGIYRTASSTDIARKIGCILLILV